MSKLTKRASISIDQRPRFVILRHEPGEGGPRPLHWDLLLDVGDRLLAWALEQEPRQGALISATELADHRREYLQYEGPVSGGRGTVTRFDGGEYELLVEARQSLAIRVLGDKLNGVATLTRIGDQRWSVAFSEA